MVLEKDEYKIENNGIWIPKKVLRHLRDHYCKVADKCKKEYFDNKDNFKFPLYIGKADVYKDLLKMFEPLEGE